VRRASPIQCVHVPDSPPGTGFPQGSGAETEAEFDDPIDLGRFDAAGKTLYLRNHRLRGADGELQIEVDAPAESPEAVTDHRA
jgi:hypothetical protein